MFTGLVESIATVAAVSRKDVGLRLSLICALSDASLFADVSVGESIALNGCCLSVVDFSLASPPQGVRLDFEVSPETLSCTNLGALQAGSEVNVERALKVGERLGGHFVTGHIDCVGEVQRLSEEGEFLRVEIGLVHAEARHLLIPKGSICVDGVSLTVNTVLVKSGKVEVGVGVMLIPVTQRSTIFRTMAHGQRVNIEFDLLGKYMQVRV